MRITRRGWAAAPVLLALAAAGCGSGSTPSGGQVETAPPPGGKSAANATQAPPANDPASPVQLAEVSVAEWEAAIAAHKGKVVLVDVWFYG